MPVGPLRKTNGKVREGVCLHGPFAYGYLRRLYFRREQAAPQAEQLPPQLFPLRLLSMVLYNASPKASATSASSAQSRRSILKYLSVETEIHVSAEEQAANLVHQASAHPGHRTLEQRHARRAPAGAHFPFDCGDGRHTGRVQQRERQKLNAASGEKMAPSASPRVETVVPVSTAMVLTTASFAEKPVMSAVEARQSVKPSGANMGAMTLPMPASILAELSATTLRRMSKDCKTR